MKKILITAAFLAAAMAAAQVGINNEAPKATLDVTAKTTDGTKPEGIIAPRLTGDQIKSGDTQYDTPQIGTIVYATAAVGGTPAGKTINITSPGYYYFDNNLVWQKLSGAPAAGNFWSLTGNAATSPIGTVPTVMSATDNYVGTKDAKNLVLGVNGISRAIITTTGSFYGGAGTVDTATLEPSNTVTGIGSFVWGAGNSATGNLVSIFGRANSTTASSTNIYGNSNVITGSNSVNTFVTGNTNTVNNFQGSLVNGKNNIINYTAAAGTGVLGNGGNLVSGQENNLSGPTTPAGIVLGGFRNTVTSSVSNMAIFGESNTVNSANTLVAGKGNTVNANMTNAAVVGTYNTPVDNSLFIVGNGVSGTTKNAVTVLNNGNVGIGTDAPIAKLQVVTDRNTGANDDLGIHNNINISGSATSSRIIGLVNAFQLNSSAKQPDVTGVFSYYNQFSSSAIGSMKFYEAHINPSATSVVDNAYAFFVNSSLESLINTPTTGKKWAFYNDANIPSYFKGYVGVGTNAPVSALHLKSFAGNSEDDIRIESNSNAGGSGSILFQRSRSSGTTLLPVNNGDSLGAIIFGGYNTGTNNYGFATNITSFYKGDGTNDLSNIVFRTQDTTRFEITETGKVVINTIATYANDAAADADTTLPSGGVYKITGSRQLFIKP